MSKKKEINLKSTPAAVESGDVNITYNNVLVGSLSESGSAVLKTEMTICEHDIELEYVKSAGGLAINTVNVTYNVTTPTIINVSTGGIVGENTLIDSITISGTGTASFNAACEALIDGRYALAAEIPANSDIYTVTCNNQPISYSGISYMYPVIEENQDSVITGQTYNVVITDKI